MDTYIPSSDKIVHETKVDFAKRTVFKTVHIVQYDSGIPVLAIELYLNGSPYVLPSNASCNIRTSKKDHTFVIKNALGCSADRKTVYFEIDNQMSYYYGPLNAIVELLIGNKIAGSSPVAIEIDRNPVQETDIESSIEYIDLIDARDRAERAAASATASEQHIGQLVNGFDQRVAEGKQEITNTKNAALTEINAKVGEAQGYANEAKGYRDELSSTIATVAQHTQQLSEHSEAIVELQGLSLSVVNGCLNITYEGV